MTMGFKWSVYVAHTFAPEVLQKAFELFKSTKLAPVGIDRLIKLQREEDPFTVTKENPLLLHIIDDVAAVAVDWPHEATKLWHKLTRSTQLNLLPVADLKSCALEEVITDIITFIGCRWDLETLLIHPAPEKVEKILHQFRNFLAANSTSKETWDTVVGKLVWFALLNRPLLSCMRRVIQEGKNLKPEQVFQIHQDTKTEMRMITALLPLATANISLPLSNIIIACEASEQAGAAVFTVVPQQLAEEIWSQAQRINNSRTETHPVVAKAMLHAISNFKWRSAFVHDFIKREHIDGLEAAAAVLSLEWIIRKEIQHHRVIIITDSLVTLGALQKGRSSASAMLVRCRRFAALALAHELRITLAYVPSKRNPADKLTRMGRANDRK